MFSKCREKNFIVVGKTSTPLEKLQRRWKNFINVGKTSSTFGAIFDEVFPTPLYFECYKLYEEANVSDTIMRQKSGLFAGCSRHFSQSDASRLTFDLEYNFIFRKVLG